MSLCIRIVSKADELCYIYVYTNTPRASFNDVFRYFMGIGVGQSIPSNLVSRSLSTFNAAFWRNYVTKFMERLDYNENFILVNYCNSLSFSLQSKLNLFWARFVSYSLHIILIIKASYLILIKSVYLHINMKIFEKVYCIFQMLTAINISVISFHVLCPNALF